jgi:hypothetical protein
MNQQIVHVGKLQAAKVMALFYLIFSIPLVLMMALAQLSAGEPVQWGIVALFPLMYVVIGFVFTFLGAWLYNGVARYLGGIEFTVVEVRRD